MAQAERDPIEPDADLAAVSAEPEPVAAAAAVAPYNAGLLATIAELTALVAERDRQLDALIGAPEWLDLRACDTGGFTCEAVRVWCKKGLVVSRREGTGKRSPIVLNTRSLAAILAQKGLSKAIKRR